MKIHNLCKKGFVKLKGTDFFIEQVKEYGTLLNLGCGKGINSPLKKVDFSFSVGVDIYISELKYNMNQAIHSNYILGDVCEIAFKENSFDVVIALDVIEHLHKREGINLINKMEKWARKKIIISTPNGFLEQKSLDGNPFQVHKSAWGVDDLKRLGFQVFGLRGWNRIPSEYKVKYEPMLIWRKFSSISQVITFRCPQLATQLIAVKRLYDKV